MTRKFLKVFFASLGVLVLLLAGNTLYMLYRHEVFVEPVYETEPPAVAARSDRSHILIFSKTNGFRHVDGIPAANAMFEDFSGEEGWTLFFTENAAVHNADDLVKFDLVVWNNVSGDVLTSQQKVAFQRYMEEGGQFLGVHATGGDPHYQWSWHPEELIRAQFMAHPVVPQFQDGVLIVENRKHAATGHLPERWTQHDEWYSFTESPRNRVHVLLSLDEESYNPSSFGFGMDLKMGDHPVVWHHRLGKGRVFYSALGHKAENYQDPEYRTLLRNAMRWLLADEVEEDSGAFPGQD